MQKITLQADISDRQHRGFLQFAAWVGVVSPVLFVLVFSLDGFLQPGYSTLSQMISWLALRPNGWVQDGNFVVFGLLLVLFAIGFFLRMRPLMSKKWLWTSTILLLVSGAGWANDGVFVSDAPGDPGLTVHGMLHNIGFLVIFSLLVITFFIIGRQLLNVSAWRRYGWYATVSGFAALGLFLFQIYTGLDAPQIAGLANRLLIIEAVAWYAVMGCRFLTLDRVRKHL